MRSIRVLSFLLCLTMLLAVVGCQESDVPSAALSSETASRTSSAASSLLSSVEDVSSEGTSSDAVSETVSDAVSEASSDVSSAAIVSDEPVSSQATNANGETTYAVAANTDKFYLNGRTMAVTANVSGAQGLAYDHAGQGFFFNADCSGDVSAQIEMQTQSEEFKRDLSFVVRVDGAQTKVTLNGSGEWQSLTLPIATGLTPGEHVFEIYRCNEAVSGLVTLISVTMKGAPKTYQKPVRTLKMVFLGDSVTCGAQLDGKNQKEEGKNILTDATRSYAFLCGEALKADFYIAARSGSYSAKDETPNSIYWTYDYVSRNRSRDLYDNTQDDVDIFVISLGTNDNNKRGLKYNFDDQQLHDNVQALIARVRADHPRAKIVWTYGQLSVDRPEIIKGAIQELTDQQGYTGLYYYQYTRPNQAGGAWHPNASAHERDAKELTDYIINTVLQ